VTVSKAIPPPPTIFIVGATGQTGKLILQELDSGSEDVHVRLGVRSQADVDRLRFDQLGQCAERTVPRSAADGR
jgi:short subunit dehydrogenase-like uncharacterized protein